MAENLCPHCPCTVITLVPDTSHLHTPCFPHLGQVAAKPSICIASFHPGSCLFGSTNLLFL